MKKKFIPCVFLILSVFLLSFSSVNAVSLGPHDVTFVSHTFDGTYSTWTYDVTSVPPPSISHGVIQFCVPSAIMEVRADGVVLPEAPAEDPNWEYNYPDNPDPTTGLFGIKIEDGGVWDEEETDTVRIELVLLGDFPEVMIGTAIKDGDGSYSGMVIGPSCEPPNGVPEFPFASAISISLGLAGILLIRRRQKKSH